MRATKPVVGFTCGDVNGIGPELIIKTLSDSRILDFCIPVIFGSNKVFNFYRKAIPDVNLNFSNQKDLSKLNHKQVNLYNCWEEEINIQPGIFSEVGGTYAVKSLMAASEAIKEGAIDMIVTAPIHKNNVQSESFNYSGHTPFFHHFFGTRDVLMLMTSQDFRVGLISEHVPVKEIPKYITREAILSKLQILNASLRRDFNIERPKIAVLALNPHAGDNGLVGSEEIEIIKPAIKEAKQSNMLVTGPFSADAFFARGSHKRFDAVLAMYHDQGLIPFKSLCIAEGINFTAGLPIVRTSPDHGTAFDIAGKNISDISSFTAAIFAGLDILNNRHQFDENHKNPIHKMGAAVVNSAADEKISE